jgi:hypothetical protein
MNRLFLKGLNAVTGIIPVPAYNTPFDIDSLSMIRAPVDHYARVPGNDPKRSTLKRKYNPPVIPAVGSLRGVHVYTKPSYSTITLQNQTHDPDNYEIIHTMEITPGMDVLLNGILIASAPEYSHQVTGKSKKITQTERARFCRGVIWWLMNDQTCLKDKLQEIGYITPVEIPAVIDPEISIESMTGSVYPGPGVLHKETWMDELPVIAEESMIRSDIEEMVLDAREKEYDALDQEIIAAFEPVKAVRPAGWIPHLRLSIIEECLA